VPEGGWGTLGFRKWIGEFDLDVFIGNTNILYVIGAIGEAALLLPRGENFSQWGKGRPGWVAAGVAGGSGGNYKNCNFKSGVL
jgi:hypothetical protein